MEEETCVTDTWIPLLCSAPHLPVPCRADELSIRDNPPMEAQRG